MNCCATEGRVRKIAYIQTLDELATEPLEPELFAEEVRRAAFHFKNPSIVRAGESILSELRNDGHPLVTAADLPGNVSFVVRLLPPHLTIGCIILEVKKSAGLAKEIRRYARFAESFDIPLHIVDGRWRTTKRSDRALAKAAFEIRIMEILGKYAIDAVMLDRTMFYVGLLIGESSPIRANVFNSHPGILEGVLYNPGKTPTINALRLRDSTGINQSGVTVHRATPHVDGGSILATARVDITDITRPTHLRTRIYAGIEAAVQVKALPQTPIAKVDWQRFAPPTESEVAAAYRQIRSPA